LKGITLKNILLTGANGFLGSHLLKKLTIKFNLFITLRKNSDTSRIDLLMKEVSVGVLYIDEECSDAKINKFFITNNINTIIHCATDYGRNKDYFYKVYESNVIFPMRLLELGINNDVKLFINTDSYFNKANMSYNTLPNYSKTKKLFLNYLQENSGSIQIFNMRLEHLYGPNDNADKFTSFVLRKLRGNHTINLTFGDQKRDFIFVDDVVNAYINILLLIDELNLITPGFSDLQIGSGISCSLKEYIQFMSDILGSNSILNFGAIEYRDDEIMNSRADGSLFSWGRKYGVSFNFRDYRQGITEMLRHEN
jgi:nucleoside-diphosphate-sugar epimerase